jgi:hypothetical protein
VFAIPLRGGPVRRTAITGDFVQNRLKKIAVIKLSRDLTRGVKVREITDPAFDVPTTIAASHRHLYAVNARFGTTDPQPAKYNVVRVP